MLLLRDFDGNLRAHDVGLVEWIMAHCCVGRLDRALGRGKSPEGSLLLALRAHELVRPAIRREFADRLERHLEDAAQPVRFVVSACVPIRRERVIESETKLRILIERLRAPGPIPARGVALVSVLLTDGAGPLFGRNCTHSLTAEVTLAIDALDPLDGW